MLYCYYNIMLYRQYNTVKPTLGGYHNIMPNNEFGDYVRERRAALRLTLRTFAQNAGLDAGNLSRLERGRAEPPESQVVLDRIAEALALQPGTPDYQRLNDLAAAAKGRIPADLLTDEEVATRLPILFRTLRSKPLSGEQLEKLIDSIRRA